MIDSNEYNAIFTKLYDVVRTINKKHNCYVIDECTSDIDNDLTTDEDITIDLDLECFSNGQDNYEEVTIFNKIYNISKSINLHHSNLLPDKIKNIKPLEDEWIILIDILKKIGYVDINEAVKIVNSNCYKTVLDKETENYLNSLKKIFVLCSITEYEVENESREYY